MYQPGVVGASSRNSSEAKLSTESHFFFFCGGNIHLKGPAPVFFFFFSCVLPGCLVLLGLFLLVT